MAETKPVSADRMLRIVLFLVLNGYQLKFHEKLRISYSLCPPIEELLNGGRADRTAELLGPGAFEHCVAGSSLLHPANQLSVIADA